MSKHNKQKRLKDPEDEEELGKTWIEHVNVIFMGPCIVNQI